MMKYMFGIFGAILISYLWMVTVSLIERDNRDIRGRYKGIPSAFALKRTKDSKNWTFAVASGLIAGVAVLVPMPFWCRAVMLALIMAAVVVFTLSVIKHMYEIEELVVFGVECLLLSLFAYVAARLVSESVNNSVVVYFTKVAPWMVFAIVVLLMAFIVCGKHRRGITGTTPEDKKRKRRFTLAQIILSVLMALVIVWSLLVPALSGWKSLTAKAADKLQGVTDSPAPTESGGSEDKPEGGSSGPMVPGEEAPAENGTGSGGDEADSTGNGDEATASQGTVDSSASAAGGSEDKPEGVSSESEAIGGTVPEKGVAKTSDLWYQINASDPQAQPGHFGPSPEIPDDITKEELGDYLWELFKDVVFGTGDYAKPDPNPAISFAFFDDMRSGKRRLDYAYCDNTMNVQQTIVGFLGDQDGGRYETFMNMVVMSIEQYHPQFGAFTGAEVRALGLDLKDQFYADYSAYMNSGGYLELPVVWECGAPADDDLFLRIRYYIKGRLVEEWLSVNCLFQACNASEVLKITPEPPGSNTPPGDDPQSQPDDSSDDPPQSSHHKNSTISTAAGRTNSNSGAGASWNNGVGATTSAAEYNNPSSSSLPPPSPDQIPTTTTPSTPTSVVASLVPGQVTVDSSGAEAAKPVEDKPSVALSVDGQPVAGTTAQGTFLVPGSG